MSDQPTDSQSNDTHDSIGDNADIVQSAHNIVNPEQLPPIAAVPKASRRKSIVLIGLILAVLVSMGTGGFFVYRRPKTSQTIPASTLSPAAQKNAAPITKTPENLPFVDSAPFADKYLPFYGDMRGYAENGSSHWYASFMNIIRTDGASYRVYTPFDIAGITTFTHVIAVNGDIWIGGQGGVAKYQPDSDTFKLYLPGEQNTKLYYDSFDQTMYVTTFANIYSYNEQTDSFSSMPGAPSNIHDFLMTKDAIISADGGNNDGSPVMVYDKQSKTWSAITDLAFVKAGGRSSEVYGMLVGGIPVVYGRDAEYNSCADQGVHPATVVYSYQNNRFVEEEALTELFREHEAFAYSLSPTALRTGECGQQKEFYVDLALQDGKIVASEKKEAKPSGFGFYTYEDKIQQLSSELSLTPEIDLLYTDKNTTYTYWRDTASNFGSTGEIRSTASGVNTKPSKLVDNSNFGNGIRFVECSGATYFINTTGDGIMFNSSYLLSVSKVNGDGTVSEIYKTTNKPLYEGVSAEFSIQTVDAYCNGNKLVMLGVDSIGTLDLTTQKFTQIQYGGKSTIGAINHDKSHFISVDRNTGQLYVLSDDIDTKKTLAYDKTLTDAPGDVRILAATNSRLVLSITTYDPQRSRLITLSLDDGSTIADVQLDKIISSGGYYDETDFILQYSDGETKLVNTDSLIGRVISKPATTQYADHSFSIVKVQNTNFIVEENMVWFSAEYWGIVGYSVD